MNKWIILVFFLAVACGDSESNDGDVTDEAEELAQAERLLSTQSHKSTKGDDDSILEDDQRNCGQFDEYFTQNEPLCQECKGPDGSLTWTNSNGGAEEVRCDDTRLSACPSTSGIGCALPGVLQQRVIKDDPRWIDVHVDIAGHMHDLCCSQHYELPGSEGYGTDCNGCSGRASSTQSCTSMSKVGKIIGKHINTEFACAVEWRFAINFNLYVRSYWFTEFDSTTRWTSSQLVRRNMGNFPGGYDIPPGNSVGAPLYGRGLAPNLWDTFDHRAPSGQVLGSQLLSGEYNPEKIYLGLNAIQIGSFCKSGKATFSPSNRSLAAKPKGFWICD